MLRSKPFDGVERRRGSAILPQKLRQEYRRAKAIKGPRGNAAVPKPIEQAISAIRQEITEVLNHANWLLLMMEAGGKALNLEIAPGGGRLRQPPRIPVGRGIGGQVAASGQIAVIPNLRNDPRIISPLEESLVGKAQSMVAVPVRFAGETLGVLELLDVVGPKGLSDRDLQVVQVLADYAAVAIQSARRVDRISELTIIDDVTRLYNVRHLNTMLDEEIYRSIRYSFEFSVVFLDVDHFKQVNDSHGHLAGSRLLGEIGQFIRRNLRLIDFAFRYGGDEFVILLPQTNRENASHAARRLHRLLRSKVWLGAERLNHRITASFGIATFPGDARTKSGLLRLADEAMYLVKQTRRDGIAAAGMGRLTGPP